MADGLFYYQGLSTLHEQYQEIIYNIMCIHIDITGHNITADG